MKILYDCWEIIFQRRKERRGLKLGHKKDKGSLLWFYRRQIVGCRSLREERFGKKIKWKKKNGLNQAVLTQLFHGSV